jgi:hypothetical protein
MACDCITVMDAKLAERNSKITCGIVFTRPEAYAVPVIEIEKLNPRKRDRVSVVPTFCPFCGILYRDPVAETTP